MFRPQKLAEAYMSVFPQGYCPIVVRVMHVEQNCRDKTQTTSLTKSHVSGADYVEHVIM